MKIMFYGDSWKATSGYARVMRELAKRLAKNPNNDVYIQQIVDSTPAHVEDGVKILPAYGQRGTDMFLTSVVNNLRIINPEIFIPICDPFLLHRDGISKIDFNQMKLILYMPLDSNGIPDTSDDILTMADHIFIMSEFGKKQLDDEGYTNNSVLYHGVNFDEFYPSDNKDKLKLEYDFNKEDFIFLAVGRNFPRKRHFRLIEAFALYKSKCTDNTKLLIHASEADNHPYNLTCFIERMEKKYNISLLKDIVLTNNHKLGQGMSQDKLLELYQLCDAYISATSGEGFGLPAIEAMACEKLVILPDNSTGKEFIGNNERGLLVKNDGFMNSGYGTQQPLVSIDDLAENIHLAVEQDHSDKILKAKDFIVEKCNWDKIALSMERTIKNVGRK